MKPPSAIMLSGGRPQGLSAAAGILDPLTLHSFFLPEKPGRRGRPRAGRAVLGKTDKPRQRVTPEVPACTPL